MTKPDWYLVERRNDARFEVWLDESDDPSCIGINAIIIGSGLTRPAALAAAHNEMVGQAAAIMELSLQKGGVQ